MKGLGCMLPHHRPLCFSAQDDLYLQQLVDACQDVVRSYAGALPALQYARSVR